MRTQHEDIEELSMSNQTPGVSRADLLRSQIEQLITAGELRAGDRLPSEQTLANELGASRSSIREALKQLQQQGLVTSMQGKGTFVSSTGSLVVERPVTKYESVTEMLQNLGYSVENIVLDVSERGATAVEAEALGLAEGSPVICLVRLRCGNGEPIVYSINVVPRAALPGAVSLRDWGQSITRMLAVTGQEIVSSAARLSAANLGSDHLGVPLDGFDPSLLVEETCITAAGERVLYSLDFHKGSKIAYNVLRQR